MDFKPSALLMFFSLAATPINTIASNNNGHQDIIKFLSNYEYAMREYVQKAVNLSQQYIRNCGSYEGCSRLAEEYLGELDVKNEKDKEMLSFLSDPKSEKHILELVNQHPESYEYTRESLKNSKIFGSYSQLIK